MAETDELALLPRADERRMVLAERWCISEENKRARGLAGDQKEDTLVWKLRPVFEANGPLRKVSSCSTSLPTLACLPAFPLTDGSREAERKAPRAAERPSKQ